MRTKYAYVEHIFEKLQNNNLEGLTQDVRFYQMHTDSEEDRKVELYFDSSSVINLYRGLDAIYRAGELFTDKFRHHSGLVHAMAYDGWLGSVHMLPKHQEEFINKLNTDFTIFPNENKPRVYDERRLEVLKHFSRSLPDLSADGWTDTSELEKLKENALLIYYLVFLLRDQGWWKTRYRQLNKEIEDKKRVHIQGELSIPDTQFIKTPLFKQVFDELSRQRPVKSINNFNDSIALCQLEDKLRAADKDNSLPIPVFYDPRSRLSNVVIKVVQQFYSNKETKPFHYQSYEGNYHLVVRDSDYFIIKGISTQLAHLNKGDNLMDFKESLLEFEDQIASFPKGIRKDLTKETFDLSLVNFLVGFMEGWLSKHAATALVDVIENIPDSVEFQKELNDFIDREKNKLEILNATASIRNQIIDQLWIGLEETNKSLISIQHSFSPVTTDASELEARFGFSQEVKERVEKILNDINQNASEAFEDGNKPSLRKLGEAIRSNKADIIAYILEAYELKYPNDFEIGEKNQERLEVGLGVLWVLERYKSVDVICDIFKNKTGLQQTDSFLYPHYRIGLLHAAALLQTNKGLDPTLAIIEEISLFQKELQQPRYKIDIGFSYLYSILWEKNLMPDPFLLPERAMHDAPESIEGKSIEYLKKGEQAAQTALANLENHLQNSELSKNASHYLRKKFYLYNNIVFLRTYGSPKEIFSSSETKRYVERIHNSFNGLDLSQPPRFHDTLARYYFRMSAMEVLDSPAQYRWLDLARKHNLKSIKLSPIEKNIYDQLMVEIEGVRRTEWYQQGNIFTG